MASERKSDTFRQDGPPGGPPSANGGKHPPGDDVPQAGASDLLGSLSTLDVSRSEVDRLVDDMTNDEDVTEHSVRAPAAKLADTMRDEIATAKAVEQLLKEPEDSWNDSDRTVRSLQAPPREAFRVDVRTSEDDPLGIVPRVPPSVPKVRRNTPAPLPPEHTRRVSIDPRLLAETIPREEEVTKKSIPLPELLERSADRDDEDPLPPRGARPASSIGEGIPAYATDLKLHSSFMNDPATEAPEANNGSGLSIGGSALEPALPAMEELEHLSLPEDAGQFIKDVAKTPSQTPLPPPPMRSPPVPVDVVRHPPTSGIAEIVQDETELEFERPSPTSGFHAIPPESSAYDGRDSAYSAPPATQQEGFRVGLFALALSTVVALILGVVIGGVVVAVLYLGNEDHAQVAEHAEGARGNSTPLPVASTEPMAPAVAVVAPIPIVAAAPRAPITTPPALATATGENSAVSPPETPGPQSAPAVDEPPSTEAQAEEAPAEAPPPSNEQPSESPRSSAGLAADATDLPDVMLLPIAFRTGSSRAEQSDEVAIERIAAIMTENRRLRVEVIGLVNPGEGVDADRALGLALMRAEAAVERIRAHGPSRRRFGARAVGSDDELEGNPTAEGFQRAAVLRVTRR